ncbi:hypothetical protein H0H92_004415 [Tricholoma furcatifolium]|nr:hypothetical protein H0H92_004415 [Tricholoma furcatifolium]
MSISNSKNVEIVDSEFTNIAGDQVVGRDITIHYHHERPSESSKRGRQASMDTVDGSPYSDADSTPRELASSGPPNKGRTYIATTSEANEAIGTTHDRTTTHMRDNVTASNVQIYHTYMGADPLIHSNIGTPQLSSMPSGTAPPFLFKPPLPPPPEYMIGRDEQKAKVIETLLNQSPAHIAILGGGGMGKTTLALSVMHDCAVAEIANSLHISLAHRDAHLYETVLSSFPENSLLCLDNLETIWDHEMMRVELETMLSYLEQNSLVKALVGTSATFE